MSDVVLVAIISAGVALATGLLTQFLTTLAASKQADRADKREALQWQRTEASRLLERRTAQGREFWALVLMSRKWMQERVEGNSGALAPGGRSPADIAGEAYAIALLGLPPEIAGLAKDFYQTTVELERHLAREDEMQAVRVLARIPLWSGAFLRLEEALLALPQGE